MSLLNQAGRFKCKVVQPASWLGESSKGTEYIGIPLEVTEGPRAGDQITWYGYLSDAAFDNTVKRLAEVFSFDGDLDALVAGRITFDAMPCSIETEIENYTNPESGESKPTCKVKWLNSADGGSGIKALEAGKVQGLMARMGGRAKAVAAAALKEMNKEPLVAKPAEPVAAGAKPDVLPF